IQPRDRRRRPQRPADPGNLPRPPEVGGAGRSDDRLEGLRAGAVQARRIRSRSCSAAWTRGQARNASLEAVAARAAEARARAGLSAWQAGQRIVCDLITGRWQSPNPTVASRRAPHTLTVAV